MTIRAGHDRAARVRAGRTDVYASSNRWMFEQPHEYVPHIVLALVPAGRAWGIDAALVRRARALRRWPF